MNATTLPNGNLKITASNDDRRELAECYRREDGGYPAAEGFVVERLREDAYFEWVAPEWVGALTDAPIFARQDDVDFPDDGSPRLRAAECPVWWYPNYMVSDPWEELKNRGRVVFTSDANS